MKGIVQRLVSDRGFGFVQGEDGRDYFVHRSAVSSPGGFDTLAEGDPVSFDGRNGPKGLRAENVTKG